MRPPMAILDRRPGCKPVFAFLPQRLRVNAKECGAWGNNLTAFTYPGRRGQCVYKLLLLSEMSNLISCCKHFFKKKQKDFSNMPVQTRGSASCTSSPRQGESSPPAPQRKAWASPVLASSP